MTIPNTLNVNTGGLNEKLPPSPEVPKSNNVDPVKLETRDQAEIDARKAIEELMKLPAREREAKIASVLDRGVINDRLKVDLPPDLYGEWCRDDPIEIRRLESLGFWVDTNYAVNRAVHSDGTSSAKIGDVIHMVAMRSTKEMIDKVQNERSDRQAKNPKKISEEEAEFMDGVERGTGGIIPTFSDGTQRAANMEDVRAALQAANAQTQVQR